MASLEAALQYGALGLLGLVLTAGLPILWLIARTAIKAFERIAKTQDALINRIDTAERSLHDNIDRSRHAGANGNQVVCSTLSEELMQSEKRLRDQATDNHRRLERLLAQMTRH